MIFAPSVRLIDRLTLITAVVLVTVGHLPQVKAILLVSVGSVAECLMVMA